MAQRRKSTPASCFLRDPGSARYLQRKHCQLLGSKRGRASKAPVKEERPDERCIADAYVKRVRELQEEGGEPSEAAQQA